MLDCWQPREGSVVSVGCSSKNYEKLCFLPLELELGLSVVGEIHRDGHDGEEGVKQYAHRRGT